MTAWFALDNCPAPQNVLDLGCGLGSVLLQLAWKLPAARLTGVEVQDVSFALLQRNVLDRQRGATREDLRLAIITWIERTYHRRRRQRRLGRLTPIEFETLTQTAHAA